jgi:UDPglucose 6-dehydrogenase
LSDVCVVGLGKLGLPFAVALAGAGHRVWAVDADPERVEAINRRAVGHDEPGLRHALSMLPLASGKAGHLLVTSDLERSVALAQVTFVIVPTPSKADDTFDASGVVAVAHAVDAVAGPGHILSVCSTVSPGTMNAIWSDVNNVAVAYSPFLIALGSVLSDLATPDVRLVGAEEPAIGATVAEILTTLGRAPVAHLGLIEAELAKLAINAYVVQRLAFANVIAVAAERYRANGRDVLRAIGQDSRIGAPYLRAGGWAGGPCFPRDSRALASTLARVGVPSWLAIAAQDTNDWQADLAFQFLKDFGRVAVLGLAYKPRTSVVEGSLGVAVARRLVANGVEVIVHDPMASVAGTETLPRTYDARTAVERVDAVFVATAWRDYDHLDVGDKPTLDLWNIVTGTNVTVRGVG